MNKTSRKYWIVFLYAILATCFPSACAEDDFSDAKNKSVKMPIQTSVLVKEKEDMLATRTGGNVAPSVQVKKLEGAARPMFARFACVNNIEKYKSFSPQVKTETDGDTRGRLVSTSEFYDDYGFIMFEYDASQTWASVGSTLTPSVHNERVLRTRGWMTNELWPGPSKKLTFFAYAPWNASGVSLSSSSTLGAPRFHYTVPADPYYQNDLLVSCNEHEVGDWYALRPITFKHACAGIRIAIGNKLAPCTITNIKLQGVYREADFDFGTCSWSNLSNINTFQNTKSYQILNGESNRIITDDEYVFMMIPQTVPSDAKLVITVNDGSNHVLETKIEGDEWEMGSTFTYVLSTTYTVGGYQLYVQKPTETINQWGGEGTYRISSYKQTYYGSQVAVPWVATYTIDDDPTEYTGASVDVPSYTPLDAGGTSMAAYTIKINHQIPEIDPNSYYTAKLRSAPDGSGDLSKGGETANCYVVTAPGTYTLPLVYGNARGNAGAYASSSFVDHFGIKIQGPNIYDYYTPSDAVLVWQDAPKLITPSSVSLTSDHKNLQFTINRDNICEGNAVVAVRDANENILWSWHIWVSAIDVCNDSLITYKNHDTDYPVSCQLMYLPLGFCHPENRNCAERHIKLKIMQQEAGGDTAYIDVVQQAGTMDLGYTATYYQWGRKDPMLPTTGAVARDKPYFDATYKYEKKSAAKVASTILFPFSFFQGIDLNGTYPLDFWNVGNTLTTKNTNPVVKSVYDPSPRGFNVPMCTTFLGLYYNYIRSVGTPYPGAWYYSMGEQNGNPFFLHIFGYRGTDGSPAYSSYNLGDYWTAGVYNNSSATAIAHPSSSYEYYTENRLYGFSVLCAKQ